MYFPEPDVIPVKCELPAKMETMLEDFQTIVNHLVNVGLFWRTTNEWDLREAGKSWFAKHYGKRYASHYLHSASSVAQQLIETWRSSGGDITATPRLRKPLARLNRELFKVMEIRRNGTLLLRITLAPYEWVLVRAKASHRRFANWSSRPLGALLVLPEGVRLCFKGEAAVQEQAGSVAIDFNFNRITLARDDGQMTQIDIHKIMKIQANHREKRKSIQRSVVRNPARMRRLLVRKTGRERNRVKDYLHKVIHGKESVLREFVGNRVLGLEDLSRCTPEVIGRANGKKWKAKMSSWIHGEFRSIAEHHFPAHRSYYARGTSGFCPFDNTALSHPIWKQSRCSTCGRVYDRDWLEALSGLVRFNSKHVKGAPWATVADVFPSLEGEFRQQLSRAPYSVPPQAPYSADMPIRGVPSTRSEPVRPECAVLSPELPSVTDAYRTEGVVQENRNEAAIWVQKSGDDAKTLGHGCG